MEKNEIIEHPINAAYIFPPIDLLNPTADPAPEQERLPVRPERLNVLLTDLGVDGTVIHVTVGASVTRYELEVKKSTHLRKLLRLVDDISLNLGIINVRVIPSPKHADWVELEIPNPTRSFVSLREMIASEAFRNAASELSFCVGQTMDGDYLVSDLKRMPHLILAGSTASGKSVSIHALLISLLYKATPQEVKLILIDPKQVELGEFGAVPHLLIPVVTDLHKAVGVLHWAVTEMQNRYRVLQTTGCRDLEMYNEKCADSARKLPKLVIVIEELSDLMLVSRREVEESLARLAQMSRAVGIHLVISTQRPETDVLTGLLRANIPSRMAFSVPTAKQSRLILDNNGAEKLIGQGDMLVSFAGTHRPVRVQGCFVSDAEVEAVVAFLGEKETGTFDEAVLQATGTELNSLCTPRKVHRRSKEELFNAAVDLFLENGSASVSLLQRKLKLGYRNATRIMEKLEEKGIVGPFQGNKPREVLITREQWASMKDNLIITTEPDAEDDE